MLEQEYVVLRSTLPQPPASGGNIFTTSAAGPGPGPGVGPSSEYGYDPGIEGAVLETYSLDDAQYDDLRLDPRTTAAAPNLRMKLIEPKGSYAAPPAVGPTWGIQAVNAEASTYNGAGVTVAVLDTGIDPTHPAFHGVTLERKNFTSLGDDDSHGHGTHCAGTIFGQDVGGQRIGVARGIEKALIGKVLGPGEGTTLTVSDAIWWAVREGAHVISMSLGADFPGFVQDLVNQGMAVQLATAKVLAAYRDNLHFFNALARTVRAGGAFGQGTVLLGASGNASERPNYTIAAETPAAGIDILAVGALQEGNTGLSVAKFSNTEVAVAAPGVGVVSAKLGGGLISMDGTSMATPHVAGVAALWAEKLLNAYGAVKSDALTAQIVGRATTGSLRPGFQQTDIGTGIVQAP